MSSLIPQNGKNIFPVTYSYKGFLYFPIHALELCGYLPPKFEFRFLEGDINAPNSLYEIENLTPSSDGTIQKSCFVICDPFANNVQKPKFEHQGNNQMVIVGALIVRLPIWLFEGGKNQWYFKREGLITQKVKRRFRKINCYTKDSTGYMIAKRLKKRLHFEGNLEPCFGGTEFDNVNGETLVVTSDVLNVYKPGMTLKDGVFLDYTRDEKELEPYLFTAILTKQKFIEEHLDSVVEFLSAINRMFKVIKISLNKGDQLTFLNDSNLTKLIMQYEGISECNITPELIKEKRILYSEFLDELLNTKNLYQTDVGLNDAEDGYNNAKKAWEETYKGDPKISFKELEKISEPIPALLMNNNGLKDHIVPCALTVDHVTTHVRKHPSVRNLFLSSIRGSFPLFYRFWSIIKDKYFWVLLLALWSVYNISYDLTLKLFSELLNYIQITDIIFSCGLIFGVAFIICLFALVYLAKPKKHLKPIKNRKKKYAFAETCYRIITYTFIAIAALIIILDSFGLVTSEETFYNNKVIWVAALMLTLLSRYSEYQPE